MRNILKSYNLSNGLNVLYIHMEVELELRTSEEDELKVMEKVMDLARKAKELGFSIKEVELENEEEEEEEEDTEIDE
jgi:hypothetical protein